MAGIQLTERLQVIADHVTGGNTVADIGSDHGYIPIWLVENSPVGHVIVSDINEGPLVRARRNFRRWLPDYEPDIRSGPGLSVLRPGEADSLIIAGMGGILISKILADDPDVVKGASALVLQPRNHSFTLRHFLRGMDDFAIIDEDIAMERGKHCEIITARRLDTLSAEERELMQEVRKAEEDLGLPEKVYEELPVMYALKGRYREYLEHKCRAEISVIENILAHGRSDYADERRLRAEKRLAAFRKVKNYEYK